MNSSDLSKDQLTEIFRILLDADAAGFVTCACRAVLIYDYLLHLSDEIEYVWISPMSLPNALYYTVRYLPLLSAVAGFCLLTYLKSNQFCKIYILGQLSTQFLTYVAATWLLSLRVLTLYDSKRWLKSFVYGFLIATHLSVAAVACISFLAPWLFQWLTTPSEIRDSYELPAQTCDMSNSINVGVMLLLILPLEILLVLLQLNHSIAQRHRFLGAESVSFRLLGTLYIDGLMYFLLVFAIRLSTGLLFFTELVPLFYRWLFVDYALTPMAVCHLFIHLRSVARHRTRDSVSFLQQPPTFFTIARATERSIEADPFRHQRSSDRPHTIELSIIEPQV